MTKSGSLLDEIASHSFAEELARMEQENPMVRDITALTLEEREAYFSGNPTPEIMEKIREVRFNDL